MAAASPRPGLTLAERLQYLRRKLADMGVDGLIVPRADEHQGEYVPACEQRLAWLTGFTGSAGMAVVLDGPRRAVRRRPLHPAGRRRGRPGAVRDPAHREPPARGLGRRQIARGKVLGYDPWLHDARARSRASAPPAESAGAPPQGALRGNPIDAVWRDRPAAPIAPVRAACRCAYAGETRGRQARRHRRRARRRRAGRRGADRARFDRLAAQHPRRRRRRTRRCRWPSP